MFHYYTKPKVIPNFLTDEEIDYIKQNTTGKFSKSGVSASISSQSMNFNKRMSETAWIDHKNHILKQISDKCATILDKKQINHEDLQVVYYKTGGFFKPHQNLQQSCSQGFYCIIRNHISCIMLIFQIVNICSTCVINPLMKIFNFFI